MDVSVILCTHNPKPHYMEKVLSALSAQTLPTDQWELLLIDNASSEALSKRFSAQWHPHYRVILEPELGLTHARLCGIRHAQGDLLVFVDDDNVLDVDFLQTTLRIAKEHPFIGAWSGQCLPGFETEPPEWTRRYWGMLVIRQFSSDHWSNLGGLAETMPCGAGLCVRRQVAQEYVRLHDSGQRPNVLDRKGNSLMSAGDNDLAACACDIGLGVGLFHALKLTHLMPAERLCEDYLVRLAEGIHYSSVFFRSLRESVPPPPSTFRSTARKLVSLGMRRVDRRIYNATCNAELRAIADIQRRSNPK